MVNLRRVIEKETKLANLMCEPNIKREVVSVERRKRRKGNSVAEIKLRGKNDEFSRVEEIALDICDAVNSLRQDNVYAEWYVDEIVGRTGSVQSAYDRRHFFGLVYNERIVKVQALGGKIGKYTPNDVLQAYAVKLRRKMESTEKKRKKG